MSSSLGWLSTWDVMRRCSETNGCEPQKAQRHPEGWRRLWYSRGITNLGSKELGGTQRLAWVWERLFLPFTFQV